MRPDAQLDLKFPQKNVYGAWDVAAGDKDGSGEGGIRFGAVETAKLVGGATAKLLPYRRDLGMPSV